MTEFETAPPQQFDPDDPSLFVAPPKWPKVVGIVSIVLAGLGLTCTGCGVVGLAFLPMAADQMGEPLPGPMMPGIIGYAMMVVGLLTVGLLLIAGITTVTRKPIGRSLHLLWALISVPLTIANVVYQFTQQAALQQWYQDNPASQWSQQQQSPVGAMVGLAVGLVIGLAWPTFCIIWFGLVKKHPGDMTGEPPPEGTAY